MSQYMVSSEILDVVSSYKLRVAAQDGHKKFISLAGFLGIPLDLSGFDESLKESSEEASEDPNVEKESAKKTIPLSAPKKYRVSDKDIVKLLEGTLLHYLPSWYLKERSTQQLLQSFPKDAIGYFFKYLPMTLSKKIRKDKIADISWQDIKISEDVVDRVVLDMLTYFGKHPEYMEAMLARALSVKESEGATEKPDKAVVDPGNIAGPSNQPVFKKSEYGYGRVFFRPTYDESSFKKIVQEYKDRGELLDIKPSSVDKAAMARLNIDDTFNWEWQGLSEHGILSFTIPEKFPADRIFKIQVPSDIGNLREEGSHTFKVQDKQAGGVMLEFVEPRERFLDKLDDPEKSMGKDQFKYLLESTKNTYLSVIENEIPTSNLIEDLFGEITVAGHQVGSVKDIQDMASTGVVEEYGEGTKGEEKSKGYQQALQKEQQSKIDRVMQTWGKEMGEYFLSIPEDDSRDIIEAVAKEFPKVPESVSLLGVLSTEPVVRMVMSIILSPSTLPSAGYSVADPWVRLAVDEFKRMVIEKKNENPVLERYVAFLAAKEPAVKAPVVKKPAPVKTAVDLGSDDPIRKFLSTASLEARFKDLKKVLKETIRKISHHPAVKRVFDRLKYWTSFIKKDLHDFIRGKIEQQPEGFKLLSKDGRKKLISWKNEFLKTGWKEMYKKTHKQIDTPEVTDVHLDLMIKGMPSGAIKKRIEKLKGVKDSEYEVSKLTKELENRKDTGLSEDLGPYEKTPKDIAEHKELYPGGALKELPSPVIQKRIEKIKSSRDLYNPESPAGIRAQKEIAELTEELKRREVPETSLEPAVVPEPVRAPVAPSKKMGSFRGSSMLFSGQAELYSGIIKAAMEKIAHKGAVSHG